MTRPKLVRAVAPDVVTATRKAIGEKVVWAGRSLERMQRENGGDTTEFQEALWAFLAAFASAQNYLNRVPGEKKGQRDALDPRLDQWLRSRPAGDFEAWWNLWRLRGLDVHVTPAAVDLRRAEHEELNRVAADAHLGVTFYRRWFVLELPQDCKVPAGDRTIPCVPLCAHGLALLQSYWNEFDRIISPDGQ